MTVTTLSTSAVALPVYVGIDIGKNNHAAAIVSLPLLAHYRRADRCPLLSFEQSRAGFDALLSELCRYGDPASISVLVESTGHYGYALIAYLYEHDICVYESHPTRERRRLRQKSDQRDARALAILLFNQLEKGVLVEEPGERARLLMPPSEVVQQIGALVQHRSELVREVTQRKNKLIAITDEVFPEMAQVYSDVTNLSALQLRTDYPTPEAVAQASMDGLLATRSRYRPNVAAFVRLQELAQHTIGAVSSSRRNSLLLEQTHLIAEMRLLQQHLSELDATIATAITGSREGKILLSCPGIGVIAAATLLSCIGSISQFESIAKLRAYCGWSPHQVQTGSSKDSMTLTRGGNPVLKQTWYLIALSATRYDESWRTLYQRLLRQKGIYDERTGTYHGRRKVLGRVIGQMIGVIYTLLKRDADLLAALPEGAERPEPVLYDAAKHHVRKTAQHTQHHQATPTSTGDEQLGTVPVAVPTADNDGMEKADSDQ